MSTLSMKNIKTKKKNITFNRFRYFLLQQCQEGKPQQPLIQSLCFCWQHQEINLQKSILCIYKENYIKKYIVNYMKLSMSIFKYGY